MQHGIDPNDAMQCQGDTTVTDIRDLHSGWMRDPSYRAEYDALEGEFVLAADVIRARADAGLTHDWLAEKLP